MNSRGIDIKKGKATSGQGKCGDSTRSAASIPMESPYARLIKQAVVDFKEPPRTLRKLARKTSNVITHRSSNAKYYRAISDASCLSFYHFVERALHHYANEMAAQFGVPYYEFEKMTKSQRRAVWQGHQLLIYRLGCGNREEN